MHRTRCSYEWRFRRTQERRHPQQGGYLAGSGARNQLERPSTAAPNAASHCIEGDRPPERVNGPNWNHAEGWIGSRISAKEDNSLVIGEKTYNELVVNLTSEVYRPTTRCSNYATSPPRAVSTPRAPGGPE